MESQYVSLFHSGELARRAARLEARLASCDICPRACAVNRLQGETGFCHSGLLPVVSSACAHHGEEPPLSGRNGSGTIFFGNCTMRCMYCQNHQISQDWQRQKSKEVSVRQLAGHMLSLQDGHGCHNINLVSPSHFVPQIIEALLEAVPMGLSLPLVYNSSGYDSLETLRELDGIIDIYLPDLKYASEAMAARFSRSPGYVGNTRAAIAEMYRQVGNLQLDASGVAVRGVIVRHLIMPNGLAGSRESLTWLAKEVSAEITLSVMAQYFPSHRAHQEPLLARNIRQTEYTEVIDLLDELGMTNGWVQEMGAEQDFLPDFDREGHPFTPAR